MRRNLFRLVFAAALVGAGFFAPTLAAGQAVPKPKPDEKLPTLRLPGIDQPFNLGDVYFMQGMIPHHAQAVKMAGWAKSHGANKQLQVLCERIVVAQTNEIKMMRLWLLDRGQWAPEPDATGMKMNMGGMVHEMLMDGMLTEEEMTALDKARGKEWDRLFLIGMIKHHGGAIKMVEELQQVYGAIQGDDMYKFTSDVFADQSIEIGVMQQMLAAIKGE